MPAGISPSTPDPGLFHAAADDEVLKGTFPSLALEHYGIASHQSLIAMAEAGNERSVAEVCRQNLHDEQAVAQFLDSNVEQVTRADLPSHQVTARASPAM